MRKLKSILTILIIAISTISTAQKIKIKKDNVFIDGELLCKFEKDTSTPGSYYLNDLENNNYLYFKWVTAGSLNYFEIYKADNLDNILFEENAVAGMKKYMIKKLYNSKIISHSGMNTEKLIIHSKKVGKEFSRKRAKYGY